MHTRLIHVDVNLKVKNLIEFYVGETQLIRYVHYTLALSVQFIHYCFPVVALVLLLLLLGRLAVRLKIHVTDC